MENLWFFAIFTLFAYIAFGAFTFYLEHDISPTDLIRRVLRAKSMHVGLPWHMIEVFIHETFMWPVLVNEVWVEYWRRNRVKRVDIILFLSVMVFLLLLSVSLLCLSSLLHKILIVSLLWGGTGIVMYVFTSVYTHNRDELLSDVGFLVVILQAVYGPLGVSRLRYVARRNADFMNSRP